MDPSDGRLKQRLRKFSRRQRAAIAGMHLPDLKELIHSMSFLSNSIHADAKTFAERLIPRLRGERPREKIVRDCLAALTVAPDIDAYLCAASAFDDMALEATPRRAAIWQECGLRCVLYAACAGDTESMNTMARYACRLASDQKHSADEQLAFAITALGWLSICCQFEHPATIPELSHSVVQDLGNRLLSRMLDGWRILTAEDHVKAAHDGETQERQLSSDAPATMAPIEPADTDAQPNGPTAIVIEGIGNSDNQAGRALVREFAEVIGARLPLAAIPDLGLVHQTLCRDHPHARAVTESFLDALSGQPHVRLRPTVLVGPPGVGKTTFAQHLLSLLGIPNEVFPCGGVADSSFMGTPRRYATAAASMPVLLVRRFQHASPGIILDEIDKPSDSRWNGALHDCLLSFLEPQSASRWLDPCLQSEVDLSHVIWLGTANRRADIPPILRDRCKLLSFPAPGIEHMSALASALLRKAAQLRGLDHRWAAPLTAEELSVLTRYWLGGSLRHLGQLVEMILVARERYATRH